MLFVGAAISALKPYIREERIPEGGVALVQPSIRTHNAGRLLDDDFRFAWGGHFTNMALLAPIGRALEFAQHSMAFFLEALGFPADRVRLRVASADADLLEICSAIAGPVEIEVDTFSPPYYRHRIGMDEVGGRNFNIALEATRGGPHLDVGNFIIFENRTTGYRFVELGYGDSTILKARYGLDHVLDCFPFPALHEVDTDRRLAVEDTAIVSIVLWREGLRPSSRDASTKVLGKYIRGLAHACSRAGLTTEEWRESASTYERRMYGDATASNEIADHMVLHAQSIAEKVASDRSRP